MNVKHTRQKIGQVTATAMSAQIGVSSSKVARPESLSATIRLASSEAQKAAGQLGVQRSQLALAVPKRPRKLFSALRHVHEDASHVLQLLLHFGA